MDLPLDSYNPTTQDLSFSFDCIYIQIDEKQMKTILKYIDIGKQEGARLVAGGKRKPGKGCFMENTVFADVNNKMRLAREEVSHQSKGSKFVKPSQ